MNVPQPLSQRYLPGGEDHSAYCDRLRQDEARLRVELTRVRTLLVSSDTHGIHLTGIENSVTGLLRENPETVWTAAETCRELVTRGWETHTNSRVTVVRASLARLVNKCVVIRVGRGKFRAVPTGGSREKSVASCLDQEDFRLAKNGLIPAEALPTKLRGLLVAELHEDGFTDVEIAERTRMTTYTTARIRARLGLVPNPPRVKGLGA